MEDAARIAFYDLVTWLEADYGIERLTAYQLCTQVARVRLANMVDTLYSVVAKFRGGTCLRRTLSTRGDITMTKMSRLEKLDGFGNVQMVEVDVPSPAPDEILAHVKRSLISRGSELFRRYVMEERVPPRMMGLLGRRRELWRLAPKWKALRWATGSQ